MALPDPDDLLRGVLSLPGALMDRLEGGERVIEAGDPVALYPLVRERARYPEAHLALEPRLSYHRAAGSVLAYRARGRSAFGIGGANAPEGLRTQLLASFSASLSERGIRRRLVFPLKGDDVGAARSAGFQVLQVGQEAFLDLPGFTVRGKPFEDLRRMRNLARRGGLSTAEEPGTSEALADVYEAWLTSKRPRWRMGLLVGSPGFETPFARRYLVARGTSGRAEAFVTLLPGSPGVWGLDVMCRRPDAPSGAIEALILHAAKTLRDEGARTLSLGACPMAGVPLKGDMPALRRIFRALYATNLGNRIFGFRRLWRFKQKFRPRWEPVSLGASPRLGVLELYLGCRMWGLY